MDLTFERGDASSPKGHALAYFESPSGDEVWATYLIVLPITVDVSKYVPPFLMNQMGGDGPTDLSSFAFPPSPREDPRQGQARRVGRHARRRRHQWREPGRG